MRHTNIQYEAELSDLRTSLLNMGELVQQQIAAAARSLVRRDTAQAQKTIDRDAEVNRLDIEIDERCIRLLALYQPAAGDLRLITTGLKITADLERIGDNAVNICQRVIELNKAPGPAEFAFVAELAAMAQSMVKDSVDAFVRHDSELAQAVIQRNREVHELTERASRELLALMAALPPNIGYGTGILFVLKNLERIADHAANIAEMVVFMARGKLIRHMAKRPAA